LGGQQKIGEKRRLCGEESLERFCRCFMVTMSIHE